MHDVFIVETGKHPKNLKKLQDRFPHAQTISNRHVTTIRHAMRNVVTKHVWVIADHLKYDLFNFGYEPPWHQADQMHVWPTGKQTDGGDTWLLNKDELAKRTLNKWGDYQHICWHSEPVKDLWMPEIFIVDVGGFEDNLQRLKARFPDAPVVRFYNSHLGSLKRTSVRAKGTHFWVITSNCDYQHFPFDWRPSWHQEHHLHVWQSNNVRFGDTFYVPAEQFVQQAPNLELLDFFDPITWHRDPMVPRLEWPINVVDGTNVNKSVKEHQFKTAMEWFYVRGATRTVEPSDNLWHKRSIKCINKKGAVSLVPAEFKGAKTDRLLDWDYISRLNDPNAKEPTQDIVFISYGEKEADLHYEELRKVYPNAKRIDSVKGVVNAKKAAARIAETPWFWFVPAKTEIAHDFDFGFSPNYMDVPMHYVFHAYNPVLDYSYGHGGIKMYHRELTLNTPSDVLDFTMHSPVCVVPVTGSTYRYNYSPLSAWRTAFREVSKLKRQGDVESEYRMMLWMTKNCDVNGTWSIQGASDATVINATASELNDWEWLEDLFKQLHSTS